MNHTKKIVSTLLIVFITSFSSSAFAKTDTNKPTFPLPDKEVEAFYDELYALNSDIAESMKRVIAYVETLPYGDTFSDSMYSQHLLSERRFQFTHQLLILLDIRNKVKDRDAKKWIDAGFSAHRTMLKNISDETIGICTESQRSKEPIMSNSSKEALEQINRLNKIFYETYGEK
ncbi:MAG: hypothetical protein ACNI27_07295 [Desulfovibrio sp.]